jgi:hypothetical protein
MGTDITAEDGQLPAVTDLRSALDHAVRWNYAGGAFGTAQTAVAALERLAAAAPDEVFGLLDQLRGARPAG